MKKLIIIIFIGLVLFIGNNMKVKALKIPDEALRLRIVANSDSMEDQNIKILVKNKIEEKLVVLLNEVDDVIKADEIIKNNLELFNESVYSVLLNNNFKINYGMNYFPQKEYKGIIYDAGEYKSLLVTIGNGEGDNWWCVLFPPLCLLEASECDEVEYKFFVSELINKFFNK